MADPAVVGTMTSTARYGRDQTHYGWGSALYRHSSQ